jgi:hypothetical protein
MTFALRSSFQQKILLTSMVFAVVLCCFFSFAPRAQASGLTEAQITAILNVLSSFGADQTTVANVNLALHNQPQPGNGASPNLNRSNPCSGGVCPGETVTPVSSPLPSSATPDTTPTPAITPTNTPTNTSTTPTNTSTTPAGTGSTPPSTTNTSSGSTNSPSSSSITFSGWPNSGSAPLTSYFTVSGVSSTQGYSVNFGDGSSGSAWQADTEAANTYYVSHTYTVGGTYTAVLSTGTAFGSASGAQKTVTIMVMSSNGSAGSSGSSFGSGAQSFDAAGMMAAVVMAPYNLLVESFTNLFVAMGLGQ